MQCPLLTRSRTRQGMQTGCLATMSSYAASCAHKVHLSSRQATISTLHKYLNQHPAIKCTAAMNSMDVGGIIMRSYSIQWCLSAKSTAESITSFIW